MRDWQTAGMEAQQESKRILNEVQKGASNHILVDGNEALVRPLLLREYGHEIADLCMNVWDAVEQGDITVAANLVSCFMAVAYEKGVENAYPA